MAEDDAIVARRRAFLVLESAPRVRSLSGCARQFASRRRYEDLCLVKMVTRLQRDYLSQPTPGRPSPRWVHRSVEYGIADWARPWGPTFLLQFEADLQRLRSEAEDVAQMAVPRHPETRRRHGRRSASQHHGRDGGQAQGSRSSTLPSWASAAPSRRPAARLASRGVQGPSRRAAPRARAGASGARRARARVPGRDGPGGRAEGRLDLNQVSLASCARWTSRSPRASACWPTASALVVRVDRELERRPRLPQGRPGTAQAPSSASPGPSARKLRTKRVRAARVASMERASILPVVAKDTEKLIRQLSLISFLMANGRPVSALEIKREVEGYSSMNDDAFARRFYADRAELESLGISLQVEKPAEGFFEAELYALPPENYYLPPIEFTDGELAALRTALVLLDGEFAYAEPLRLALQQVSWGRPSPLEERRLGVDRRQARPVGRGPRAVAAPGEDRDRDLAPQDDRVQLLLDGARRGLRPQGRPLPPRLPQRPVLPDRPLARARRGARVPPLADPRQGLVRDQGRARLRAARGLRSARLRVAVPTGRWARSRARRRVFLRERIAWLVERDFGAYGESAQADQAGRRPRPRRDLRDRVRLSPPADLLGAAAGARTRQLLEPEELAREATERLELLRSGTAASSRSQNGLPAAGRGSRPLAQANGRPAPRTGARSR